MPMKIEVLKEKENKPLQRREIEFRVDHTSATTPSRADIHAKIMAQYNADAATVVIRKLRTNYGIGVTDGTARIYSSPEQMNKVELIHILKRHESKKKESAE
jgi:small subunit ribosomal protein S24e